MYFGKANQHIGGHGIHTVAKYGLGTLDVQITERRNHNAYARASGLYLSSDTGQSRGGKTVGSDNKRPLDRT